MVFLDVELIEETAPLDMGDEFVMLSLDQNYGVVGDGRVDDGVVGDNQILLDQKPDGGVVAGDEPHVVFAIDVSTSTTATFGGASIGDVNNDGDFNSILDAQLAALIALNQSFVNSGDTVRVSVVIYGVNADSLDLSIAPGLQSTVDADADSNNDGTPDVEELLAQITFGGGGLGLAGGGMSITNVGGSNTNFVAALNSVGTTIVAAGTTPDNANVVFLSDGQDNSSGLAAAAAGVQAIADNVQAFGIGTSSSLGDLDIVDLSLIHI